MMMKRIEFGMKKALKYRADMISWFLADLSLYFSNFFLYFMLVRGKSEFLGMSSREMLIYISTYTLTNNLFAIFYSESVSAYSSAVEDGEIAYNLLYPLSLDKTFDLFNFNFSAFLMTPFLLGLNIILIMGETYNIFNTIAYYFYLMFAALCMKYIFSFIHSLKMLRLKTESLSGVIYSMLSIGEKPAHIFEAKLKSFLTFIFPAFIMSYIPFSLLKGNLISTQNIIFLILPLIWYLLYRFIIFIGKHIFQCDF